MRDIALQRRDNGRYTFVWDSTGDVVWDERAVYPVMVTLLAHKNQWRWDDGLGVGTYLHRVKQDRMSTSSQLTAYAQDGLDQVKAQGAILSGEVSAQRRRTGVWSLTLQWQAAGARQPEPRTLVLGPSSPEVLAGLLTGEAMRDALVSAWPPGSEQVLDWTHDPGRLLAALGYLFQRAADQVEELRLELCPLTATANLVEWERAYGCATSAIAVSGTRQARIDQITSRARETGATTFDNIRAIVQPFLKYADPAEIVILETSRDALRAEHTRAAVGYRSSTWSYSWTVFDTGVCDGGAQVDVDGDFPDLAKVSATLVGPSGASAAVAQLGRGARGQRQVAALLPDALLAIHSPYSAWGSADDAMWFLSTDLNVGEARYLFWDGSALSAETPPTTFTGGAIHGTAADDIWTAGGGGVITHYDGTAWSDAGSPTNANLNAVFAAAPDVAYAVGAVGTVVRWDGTSWSVVANALTDRLTGVWCDSTGQIVVVCAGDLVVGNPATNGRIYKSVDGGATWATLLTNTPALLALWGGAEHDIWVVGRSGNAHHLDQDGVVTTTSAANANTVLFGVGASSKRTDPWTWGRANDVWAVGHDTVAGATKIVRWDGTQWYAYTGAANQSPNQPRGVFVLPTGEVWIGFSARRIMHIAPTGSAVRLYFPSLDGTQVAGTWTLTLVTVDMIKTYGAELFVEGRGRVVGWDGFWYQGLSGAKFEWGVMVEDAKLGAGYDLDACRLAILRITYARSFANILRRSVGAGALPAGQFGAIPDDPNSIPDQCIPG